jgi:hypothetical protein
MFGFIFNFLHIGSSNDYLKKRILSLMDISFIRKINELPFIKKFEVLQNGLFTSKESENTVKMIVSKNKSSGNQKVARRILKLYSR